MSSGSVVMPESPCLMPRPSSSGCDCSQKGSDSTIRKLAESTRLITGRAITARLARSQKPPGRPCSIWPCRTRRESHDESLRTQRVREDRSSDEPEESREPDEGAGCADDRRQGRDHARGHDHAEECEGVRDPRHPRPVEPIRPHALRGPAEQGKHRRQERHRRRHRDQDDDDRAARQAAEDRRGHEEHARQGDHDREPAEKHGAVRRGTGAADRAELVATLRAPRDTATR